MVCLYIAEQVATRQGSLFVDHIYILEVAHLPVEIKAVSYNEFRRNGERHIVGNEAGFRTFRLVKQRYEAYRPRVAFFQVLYHHGCCQPGVHDILHDNDIHALDILGESHDFLHLTCGRRAFVA